MILREATIKYKGYDPDELSLHSGKRICVSCDICGRVRWISKDQYRDLCHRCSLIKRWEDPIEIEKQRYRSKKRFEDPNERKKCVSNGMKGKQHTEITKEKLRKIAIKRHEDNPDIFSGENNPMYGLKGKDSPNYVERIIIKCQQCGCDIDTIPSRVDTQNFCCKDCQNEWQSENQSGKNNPNWQGGISSEREILNQSREYKEWRTSIFQRDNYICQMCGNRGYKLNAHHILKFSDYPELIFEINNGITLCYDCHFHKVNQHEKEYEIEFLSKIFDNKGKEIFGDIK